MKSLLLTVTGMCDQAYYNAHSDWYDQAYYNQLCEQKLYQVIFVLISLVVLNVTSIVHHILYQW